MSAWSIVTEDLTAGDGVRLLVRRAGSVATSHEVLRGWMTEPMLREAFNDALARSPLEAFCWEVPAWTRRRLEAPFECVLVPSAMLARMGVDDGPFGEHFRRAPDDEVVRFDNLGGDAHLVAPCPRGPRSAYGHLAAFVRSAPTAQRDALWRVVGEAVDERLGDAPLWISTAGLGVAWLHVRLDRRPKYYRHAPYRLA